MSPDASFRLPSIDGGVNRVITLIPSATEIVCALGARKSLVGRSHECDFPVDILELPICSEAKLDASVDSQNIDRQVKSILLDATSVYRVFIDGLERLRPTHIVTQSQCDVCAVSLQDVQAAICELTASHPQIISLSPNTLEDVWNDIIRVAEALGFRSRGESLVNGYRDRLHRIAERSATLKRPNVVCIEWLEPLMSAGNWIPELAEIAGGRVVLSKAGVHSPWLNWEELVAEDPDVIAIMPCGFDIARSLSEMHWMTERNEWSGLRAVREQRVYITDGNQFFNRPGPRLVESAEIFSEILHPTNFDYGHKMTGWVPFHTE